MGRIGREKKTVAVMIRMYCRHHHATQRGLCKQCEELLEYAHGRLDRCPFGEEKPACSKCPIHCYRPDQRERVREAMRFAGPRMLTQHPILAVQHLLDGRKGPPEKTGKK